MKTVMIFITTVTLYHAAAEACSCSEYPLNPHEAIKSVVRNEVSHSEFDFAKDVDVIKSYPTLFEQLNLSGFKGRSCEVHGPKEESHDYCSPSNKADYLIRLNQKNCELIVRVKSTLHKISVRIIRSTCNEKD